MGRGSGSATPWVIASTIILENATSGEMSEQESLLVSHQTFRFSPSKVQWSCTVVLINPWMFNHQNWLLSNKKGRLPLPNILRLEWGRIKPMEVNIRGRLLVEVFPTEKTNKLTLKDRCGLKTWCLQLHQIHTQSTRKSDGSYLDCFLWEMFRYWQEEISERHIVGWLSK